MSNNKKINYFLSKINIIKSIRKPNIMKPIIKPNIRKPI